MNITFIYLRGQTLSYELISKLIEYRMDIIKKFYKKSEINSYMYSTSCVKKMPIRPEQMKYFPGHCNNPGERSLDWFFEETVYSDGRMKTRKRPKKGNKGVPSNVDQECLECWRRILCNTERYLDVKTEFPLFLKKKEIPKFLK